MTIHWTAARLRHSLLAVAAGWAAAVLLTLPMQYTKIIAIFDGPGRGLLQDFAGGTLVWMIWTLPLALSGWLFVGLPVVTLISDEWLLRRPRLAILVSSAASWLIVLYEFKVWRAILLPEERLGVRLFSLYSLLFVVFAATTASVYLWLARRRRGGATSAA